MADPARTLLIALVLGCLVDLVRNRLVSSGVASISVSLVVKTSPYLLEGLVRTLWFEYWFKRCVFPDIVVIIDDGCQLVPQAQILERYGLVRLAKRGIPAAPGELMFVL